MQDKQFCENLSSPTVATQSVFMVISIGAAEKRIVVTGDIVGAYLNASMYEHLVIMEIDPFISLY